MSMILNLTRVTEATLDSLHQNPESINTLLYPEFETTAAPKPGLLSRLFGANTPKLDQQLIPQLPELSEEDTTDLDKTWHALHFLFTGSDWEGNFPEGFLVTSGKPIGNVDVGYGPAKSFDASRVQQISEFLRKQAPDQLRSKFDYVRLKELDIYPSIWESEDNLEEDWEYVMSGFQTLKQFIHDTADQQKALIIYIN